MVFLHRSSGETVVTDVDTFSGRWRYRFVIHERSLVCACRVYGMSDPVVYCKWLLQSTWWSLKVFEKRQGLKPFWTESWLRNFVATPKVNKLPNCFRKSFQKKKIFENYIGFWESVSLRNGLISFKSDVWRIQGVDCRVVTFIDKRKVITR